MTQNRLTSEKFYPLFRSKFHLTNYAIDLARFFIQSGREISLDQILEEVRRNPNPSYLEQLKALEQEDGNTEQT